MSRILVVSGHQDFNQSVCNALILQELETHFGDNISVRRLSDLYPDYKIDVKAEQEALVQADIVLLQYPTFWFNTPAIIKKWLDDVWLYGFAYGEGGTNCTVKSSWCPPPQARRRGLITGKLSPPLMIWSNPSSIRRCIRVWTGRACILCMGRCIYRACTMMRIWHNCKTMPNPTPKN